MFLKLFTIFFFSFLFQSLKSSSQVIDFTYNGFLPPIDSISIQGITTVTPNGLLKLTNYTIQKTGHAFYSKPIRFKDSANGSVSSFSTTFVFAIHSQIPILSGHGIAFVIAPNPSLPYGTASQYLGLFNISNNGNKTNNVFAVEFDTIISSEFNDPNDNHFGIDINSLRSDRYASAGWWNEKGEFKNLSLISSKPMQVWVDYDGLSHKLDVSMAPFNEDKPIRPLLSIVRDLSSVILQDMFVGFSSATGSVPSENFILGWSFRLNGMAPQFEPLNLSKLPKLPQFEPKRIFNFFKIGMLSISLFLIFSTVRDLSSIILQDMFVGFSSGTGSVLSEHFILGWSFRVNGKAPPLALSKLPKLPQFEPKRISNFFKIGMLSISLFLIFSFILLVCFIVRRKLNFAEEIEDWEKVFLKNRFKFKDLYYATKGFGEKVFLGSGRFGRVYKGMMPGTKLEVAVKRVSHESRQGLKELVSEIVSIGRMGHRNLVPLLGYCRRRGELLLVYDYMPNGSLDKYLYNTPKVTLCWKQRIKVILGVVSGLFYLHEEWEQVVIHRDVKAGNVLLDGEFNGRLADFGLARLYNHGSNPQTTHVAGTFGYLAPEHTRTGRATTATDVFAFGVGSCHLLYGQLHSLDSFL